MMDIIKKAFPTIIIGFLLMLTLVFHVALSGHNKPVGSIHGIALDSKENLYVGYNNGIWVMSSDAGAKSAKHLSIPVSQTYKFYIQEDLITVGCKDGGNNSKIYSLDGNMLKTVELSYQEVKKVADSRNTIRINGNEYTWTNYFGFKPSVITRNGDFLYQMTTLEYLFTAAPFVILLAFLGVGLAIANIHFLTDEEVRIYFNSQWKHM